MEHAPTPTWWSPKYLLLGLGLVALLALLSYPLFPAPIGLGALAALAVTRTLLLGRPFPASPFNLPLGLYLSGALVGLQVSVWPHVAAVR